MRGSKHLETACVGLEVRWRATAFLIEDIRKRLYDSNTGVFFMTPQDYPHLLCRRLDYFDSPTPSGRALTTEAMLRLGIILSQPTYIEAAKASLGALAGWMRRSPICVGHALYLRQTLVRAWKTWVFVLPQADDLPLEKRSTLPPLWGWLSTIAGTFNPPLNGVNSGKYPRRERKRRIHGSKDFGRAHGRRWESQPVRL